MTENHSKFAGIVDRLSNSLPRGNNLIKADDTLTFLKDFPPFLSYLNRQGMNEKEIEFICNAVETAGVKFKTVSQLRGELSNFLRNKRVEVYPNEDQSTLFKTKALLAIFIDPKAGRDFHGN